jgi:hypothetical protein
VSSTSCSKAEELRKAIEDKRVEIGRLKALIEEVTSDLFEIDELQKEARSCTKRAVQTY